ncbi:hypothetical protein NAEX_07377 [Nannocystis exedens]|nr:hypothetical protein NAEX_07377 [Nannocystis exedens]
MKAGKILRKASARARLAAAISRASWLITFCLTVPRRRSLAAALVIAALRKRLAILSLNLPRSLLNSHCSAQSMPKLRRPWKKSPQVMPA